MLKTKRGYEEWVKKMWTDPLCILTLCIVQQPLQYKQTNNQYLVHSTAYFIKFINNFSIITNIQMHDPNRLWA